MTDDPTCGDEYRVCTSGKMNEPLSQHLLCGEFASIRPVAPVRSGPTFSGTGEGLECLRAAVNAGRIVRLYMAQPFADLCSAGEIRYFARSNPPTKGITQTTLVAICARPKFLRKVILESFTEPRKYERLVNAYGPVTVREMISLRFGCIVGVGVIGQYGLITKAEQRHGGWKVSLLDGKTHMSNEAFVPKREWQAQVGQYLYRLDAVMPLRKTIPIANSDKGLLESMDKETSRAVRSIAAATLAQWLSDEGGAS